MPKNIRYALGAGLVLLLLFFGCHRRQIELANGYKLTWLSRHRISITDPARGGSPLIDGNVEQYAVSAPFIVGYASTNHINAGTNAVAGYFILRTDNRERLQALPDADWTNELNRIHWANPPLQQVP